MTTLPSTINPLLANSNTRKKNSLIPNTTIQGIQLFSLLTPIYSLLKPPPPPPLSSSTTTTISSSSITRFSPKLFLKRCSIGTFLIGGLGGASVGFVLDSIDLGGVDLNKGAWRRGEMRRRDYSIIGGVVGGLLTTTVFLRRVPIVYCIAGGISLGVAGGVITDLVETFKVGEKVIELKGV